MSLLIAVVLLIGAPDDLARLIDAGRYAEAVATARTPAELHDAVVGKGDAAVRGVVRQVARLKGVLDDAASAAAWCEKLGTERKGDPECLTVAGYLYLRANQPDRVVKAIESGRARTALGLAYLADAHRRGGRVKKASDALLAAAARKDAPKKFLEDVALSLAAHMRATRDRGYAELLRKMGLALRAATWLADDLSYDRAATKQDRARVAALFEKGLDDRAPATAWWTASSYAEGDTRLRYLVEAVQRGADERGPSRHRCPGAILDLARECLARKRFVAAAALAQRRLAVGECPAAWEILESMPPNVVRKG